MDESAKSPSCRICLGSIEFPRNLVQPKYKDLKQILTQILGYEIPTKSGTFNICYTCENKLTWILEFKDLCEKSLSAIQEIELKKEVSDSEGNDNDTNYTPEVILSEGGDAIETLNKLKENAKRSPDKGGKLSKPTANVKLRRTKYKQYSANIVTQAITECNNYITDAKTRICIFCAYEGTTSTILSVHMYKNHNELTTNWCNRCNIHTENLEMHRIATQCAENRCKFCSKKCKNTNKLAHHLTLHCHSFFKEPVEPEIEAPTMIWFKEDPFAENTDVIDTLKEGIKGANVQVLKRKLRRISTAVKNASMRQKSDEDEGGAPTRRRNCRSQKVIVTDLEKDNEENDSDDEPLLIRTNKNKAKSRYKQFSAEKVQEAIYETMKAFRENRKCIVCGHLALQLRSLSLHMSQFHKDVADKWCSRCNALQDNIKEHKESHKGDCLKCKFCEKRYTEAKSVRLHLRKHALSAKLDIEVKWFSCKRCPKSYQTERELKEHDCEVAGNENDVKLKPCKICGDKFPNLRIHLKQIHWVKKGPKKRLCPICGKVFVSNYKLTVHIRTHTGEKPFKCSFCDKQFNIRRSLETHERRHVGEKRHICHICAKAFVTSAELKTHSRTHEAHDSVNEQCQICEKKFYRSGVLQIHMKKHRGFQTAPRSSVAAAPVNNVQLVSPPPQVEIKHPTDPFQMFFANMC